MRLAEHPPPPTLHARLRVALEAAARESTARVAELESNFELLKKEAEDKCRAWAEEATSANANVRSAAEAEVSAARAERDAARTAAAEAAARADAAEARARDAPSARVIAALEADATRGGAAAHTALEVLRRVGGSGGAGGGGLGSVELYARVEIAESALGSERAETAKLCARAVACVR